MALKDLNLPRLVAQDKHSDHVRRGTTARAYVVPRLQNLLTDSENFLEYVSINGSPKQVREANAKYSLRQAAFNAIIQSTDAEWWISVRDQPAAKIVNEWGKSDG